MSFFLFLYFVPKKITREGRKKDQVWNENLILQATGIFFLMFVIKDQT